MAVVKELNADLVHQANYNSMGGKRGDLSDASYKGCAEKILSWPVSEEKKQKLLNKLHEKCSEILKYEAQHVSVMVAGPARYNPRKLDKSDRILKLSSELYQWLKDLEGQVQESQRKNNKAESLLKTIEFCRSSDNPCDPTGYLAELAMYDNQSFIRIYEESVAGEIKEIRKEVFFEDENLTAYMEGDRAYIKFIMRPKRQLHVALKSRGWWWNSYQRAYSTYPDRLDKEWVSSISTRYADYV